jgi:uncharacterized protein (TIGR02453 family)
VDTGFKGFPKSAVQFLRDLAANNNRDWFQQNKETFESSLRGPAVQLVEILNRQFCASAPKYETDPKQAIFRIHRDTRFSKDKSPYKTHVGMFFWKRGLTKEAAAGVYVALEPARLFIAGGSHAAGPAELLAIRTHVQENHKTLRKIISDPQLLKAMGEFHGEELSRPPHGSPKDHPAIDLIRKKQWLFTTDLPLSVATSTRCTTEIWSRFELMMPFVEFLNVAITKAKRKDPLELSAAI